MEVEVDAYGSVSDVPSLLASAAGHLALPLQKITEQDQV